MSTGNRYRLSLHVSHPAQSASEVIFAFGLEPRYSKSIGAPRIGRSGALLGGIWNSTEISFAVSNGVQQSRDLPLVELLSKTLTSLDLRKIDSIVSTGGKVSFIAGIYTEDNYFFELPSDLMRQLAEHNIGVKLDIYGGPDIEAGSATG